MALFNEFRHGDGVLYGALSKALKFFAEQNMSGGARHGAVDFTWDVSEFDAQAVMIVSSPRNPAAVPEEGTVVMLNWDPGTGGKVTASSEQGTWTYYSLFVLDKMGRWKWVSFTLFLPVSDWGYRDILPKLLPGAAVSDDMNVRAEPDANNMIVEWLGEFGFLIDEVKTAAEALVPFWDKEHIVPQAGPALASLMRLDYIAELGPKVYSDLMALGGYSDNTLGVLGQKAAIVTRWPAHCRVSHNHFLNLNDSSAEGSNIATDPTDGHYYRSAWVDGHGNRPFRKERSASHPPEIAPAIFNFYDVKTRGYFQFPTGTYTCGTPTDPLMSHALNIRTWPTAVGGFFARLPEGATTPVGITFSLITKPYGSTQSLVRQGVRFPLVHATVTSNNWEWFPSKGIIPLGTDNVGFPHIAVGLLGTAVSDPSTPVVDIDVAVIGPGVSPGLTIPNLIAVESRLVPGLIRLTANRGPDYGTARINWGDGSDTTEVTWKHLMEGITHVYTGVTGPDMTRFHISAKDYHDEWLYASCSVDMHELRLLVGP